MGEEKKELNKLMKLLDAKRQLFLTNIQKNRGIDTEVNGGRSIMRTSQISIATSDAPSLQMKQAIGAFFKTAQGGDNPKEAMVVGATQLISAGIDLLFGVSEGTGMEKKGFVVLFLNYAFVRVDYYIYTYCVKGTKWGVSEGVSGSCYVTNMSVLDPSELTTSEIDYLISQSITPSNDKDFKALLQVKIMLSQSAALTRVLQDDKTDLAVIKETAKTVARIQSTMKTYFGKMANFRSLSELMSRNIELIKEQVVNGGVKFDIVKDFMVTELVIAIDKWNETLESDKKLKLVEFKKKVSSITTWEDLTDTQQRATGSNKAEFDKMNDDEKKIKTDGMTKAWKKLKPDELTSITALFGIDNQDDWVGLK